MKRKVSRIIALLVIILLSSFTPYSSKNINYVRFTVPEYAISGSDLKDLVYKYSTLFGLFKTEDGVDYELVFYGQSGSDYLPVTSFVSQSSRTYSYPCVFGNILWVHKLQPRDIKDNEIYSIEPKIIKTADGERRVIYRWAHSDSTPQITANQFNPVPPKSAIKLD